MKVSLATKAGNVTIRDAGIGLGEPELDAAAEEIAENVRAAVAAQPGDRWDRTGKLRTGIRADGASVVVPPDRLEREGIAEKFRAEVMPSNVLDDAEVRRTIAEAVHEAVKAGVVE